MSELAAGCWFISYPGCFNPKEEPQYPLNRRMGRLQSQYGCFGEEKNSCPCQEDNSSQENENLILQLLILIR